MYFKKTFKLKFKLVKSVYRRNLGDCGSSKLYLPICVCLFVCLSVCLSVTLLRLISQLLLDGLWWNLVEVLELKSNCIKFHKNRFSDDVLMTSLLIFLVFFFKGGEFCGEGNSNYYNFILPEIMRVAQVLIRCAAWQVS